MAVERAIDRWHAAKYAKYLTSPLCWQAMTEPAESYWRVLQCPGIGRLLISACWARLAARMFSLVIVLYTLGAFGSPILAGWVSFAAMVPGLVVSPLAGAVLDRIGVARAVTIDMMAGGVLLTGLVAAHVLDEISPPLLLVTVACYSLTNPLGTAGIRTLIPRLLTGAARDRANALDTSSYAIVDVLGPVIAGVLFGFAGATVAMLVIVACYVAAAVSLFPLIGREPSPVSPPSAGLFKDAVNGLAYVVRHVTLRGLAVCYALYQVSFGVLVVAVPVFVAREIGNRDMVEPIVGGLWALAGLSGGIGALYTGSGRIAGRERLFMTAGTLLTALAIYPTAAYFGLVGLAIGLMVVGLLTGPVDVGLLSLRQRCTDPAWLGRSLAISMSLNLCGMPLGAVIGGMLLVHSLPLALAIAALASVLAAVATLLLVPACAEGVN